jgi:arabinofuranosyltransferase
MSTESDEGIEISTQREDTEEDILHQKKGRLQRVLIFFSVVMAIALSSVYGLCAQDDAFISFRYAQHFWEGDGLVFNPGDRVEGITNLLWTLMFVPVFALGLDPVLLSVFFGLGSLLLLFWGVRSLCLLLEVNPVWACWLLAFDASILLESMEGLESVFFSGLLCWGIVWGIRAKGSFSWQSICFFSLAMLTRPEAPLVFIIFQVLCWWSARNLRTTLLHVVSFGFVGVVLTLWRLWYYGDVFPNTFYAKVGGFAFERGILYLRFYAQYHLLLVVGVIWSIQIQRFRGLLFLYAVYLLYVCAVGGDFKPTSRFMLPLVCVAIVVSAHLLSQARGIVRIVLLMLWLFPQARLYQRSLHWAEDRRNNLIARRVAGFWIRANIPPYAKIAIHSVGVIPFYAQRYTIDMWGLNDRVIARTPVRDFGSGLAGHERSNPEYVFAQRPDLYLPEEQVFLPKKVEHVAPDDFPSYFVDEYRSISIQIEASYLNIWVRKDLIPDKEKTKEVKP